VRFHKNVLTQFANPLKLPKGQMLMTFALSSLCKC